MLYNFLLSSLWPSVYLLSDCDILADQLSFIRGDLFLIHVVDRSSLLVVLDRSFSGTIQFQRQEMINNYFQDEQYHPSDAVYQHPIHHNYLHIGDMSAAVDIDYLHQQHIKTVITAAAGMEHIQYDQADDIQHIVYSLLDIKSQNIGKHFNPAHELIQQALAKGSVLVHCAAGISRSATLVIAYLMKQMMWTFRDAIAYVRQSRLKVCPNLGFERQLKEYEQLIAKQRYDVVPRRGSKTSEESKHNLKNPKKIQLPEINSLGRTQIKSIILNPFIEQNPSRAGSRSHREDRSKKGQEDHSYRLKPIKMVRKTKSLAERETSIYEKPARVPNIDFGGHSVFVNKVPFAESKTQRLIRRRPLNRIPIANYHM